MRSFNLEQGLQRIEDLHRVGDTELIVAKGKSPEGIERWVLLRDDMLAKEQPPRMVGFADAPADCEFRGVQFIQGQLRMKVWRRSTPDDESHYENRMPQLLT